MARLDNNFVLNSASNECLLGHVRDVKNKSHINNVFLVHRAIRQYKYLYKLDINHKRFSLLNILDTIFYIIVKQ